MRGPSFEKVLINFIGFLYVRGGVGVGVFFFATYRQSVNVIMGKKKA
jgi:hypothetical protein